LNALRRVDKFFTYLISKNLPDSLEIPPKAKAVLLYYMITYFSYKVVEDRILLSKVNDSHCLSISRISFKGMKISD